MEGLSPEALAEITKTITERVKRELFEHLKQSGSVEDPSKAPPMQRDSSKNSNSSSSPTPTTRRVYTPPSPTQSSKTMYGNPLPEPMSARSPPSSPLEKPAGVRFSDRTIPTRSAVGRTFSSLELSAVDQKWGRLFDSEGNPTPRLGQFLIGLANHIVKEFPSKCSIVVTPSKMAAYYESYALEKEPHPLLAIFRAQSNEQISLLYQDLGCQHHLVQETPNSAPVIPALTPVGFAQWMTLHILAYPEEEWKRLEKVVLKLPIDADGELVDGKPERLPKQISRHLLPESEDRKSRKLINEAIESFLDNLGSAPRRKASITSPPISRRSSASQTRTRPVEIHQIRTSPTTAKAQPVGIERDRKPYAGAPGSEASSNEENGPQIERERQPYSAQPGVGKVYTENVNLKIPNRMGRANSTSSRPSAREQPERTANPEPRHNRTHSNSTAGQSYNPPPRTRGRRTSSPPIKSFRNTAPEDINITSKYGPNPGSSSSSFTPGSFESTKSFPPPPGPPPFDMRDGNRDPNRRSRDERQYKRNIDDDLRFAGEMNSPRDAERLDRYQEALETERNERGYGRESISIDPRDTLPRGAPAEEWYRKEGRNNDFDSYRRY